MRIDGFARLQGTVREIVPRRAAASRSVLVKVTLAPAGHVVYIGMFGRLESPSANVDRIVTSAEAVQAIGQQEVSRRGGRERDLGTSLRPHGAPGWRRGGNPLGAETRARPWHCHETVREGRRESRPGGSGTHQSAACRGSSRSFCAATCRVLLILISLVAGAVALLVTPREEEPQIVVPLADVLVSMPGASAEEVEQQVAIAAGAAAVPDRRRGVRLFHVAARPGRRHRALLRRRGSRRQPDQAVQQDRDEHRRRAARRHRLGGQADRDRRRADRQRDVVERSSTTTSNCGGSRSRWKSSCRRSATRRARRSSAVGDGRSRSTSIRSDWRPTT